MILKSKSKNKNLCVILGGGGHTKSLIDSYNAGNYDFKVVGILDPNFNKKDTDLYGIPYIGNDDLIPILYLKGVRFFINGLGSSSSCVPRKKIYELAIREGLAPISIIHPKAYISPYASLGIGVQILPNVTIMPDSIIDNNVILNTNSIIEHDCCIGMHSHVASGAHLAGNVSVGACTHIGIGSVIRQGICIGNNVIVGAGAVVVKDILSCNTVIGNPAKIIRK